MAKHNSLRDWAEGSYDGKTGRAASSLEEAGSGRKGNHTTDVTTHLDQAHGVGALNKSGSADGGRNKWGGSKLP